MEADNHGSDYTFLLGHSIYVDSKIVTNGFLSDAHIPKGAIGLYLFNPVYLVRTLELLARALTTLNDQTRCG